MNTTTHSICRANFDKICRICLITTENSPTNCFKELLNKLQYCISVKLEEEVTLPSTFCGNCTNTINVMYNFKELCIYSQQILSDILRNELVDIKTEETSTKDNDNLTHEDVYETDNTPDPLDIKKENINNSRPQLTNSVENLKSNEPIVKKKKKYRYKCLKCDKLFKSYRTRDNHMQLHIPKEQRLHRCSFQNCKKAYINKEKLIEHEQKHQLKPRIKEQCNICGITVVKLQQHMLAVHSENKPYQCTKCTSKFAIKLHLRYHMAVVHEGKRKKNLLCPECGQTFYYVKLYEAHLYQHAGEKPYKCSSCPYATTLEKTLRNHMETHNENRVKKYSCTYCDKKFSTGNTLRSHIRSHTGERPYACKLCDKRYTQRASLRLHFKSHQLDQKLKTEMVKN